MLKIYLSQKLLQKTQNTTHENHKKKRKSLLIKSLTIQNPTEKTSFKKIKQQTRLQNLQRTKNSRINLTQRKIFKVPSICSEQCKASLQDIEKTKIITNQKAMRQLKNFYIKRDLKHHQSMRKKANKERINFQDIISIQTSNYSERKNDENAKGKITSACFWKKKNLKIEGQIISWNQEQSQKIIFDFPLATLRVILSSFISVFICLKQNCLLYLFHRINILNMSDIESQVRVLKQWKEHPQKTIKQVLDRVSKLSSHKGKELELINSSLIVFHKQIMSQDEEENVCKQWFPLCINLKKKLKKLLEIEGKEVKQKLSLEKKQSHNVNYPPSLLINRGPTDQQRLKILYQNFIANFQQAQTHTNTVNFIITLLTKVKVLFLDKNQNDLNRRVSSIGNKMCKETATESKKKMLAGQITAIEVSTDDEDLFLDEQGKARIKQKQLQLLEENNTGFYDEMKKLINKDASEQCRYCHKKNAYCEDMKQIRASDEPMTRFMRCNNCNKAWRD